MLCPHCNQDIPLNQQYCPICGKKVEVGIEHIESTVAADVAERHTRLAERVLINVVGALIVIWVGLKLWNDYYLQEKLPGATSGSFSFSAPPPEMKDQGRLEVQLTPPVVEVPEIPRVEPRGMSWRRDPFRERLRAAAAGEFAPEAAAGVAKGLDYLKGRQQKDGGWLVSGGVEGGAAANEWGRCGVTGLACLAFLGDGHAWTADDKDPYAAAARRGIAYLIANQDESGRFGPKEAAGGTPHYMYNQGMAAAAVAEAYAMTGDPDLRLPAQKGINYILTAQQRSGGWDYYEMPGSRADTSVTAWQIMALYSASQAGLNVPAVAFEKGLAFIDAMTEKEKTFRVGYDRVWSPSEKVGNGSTAIALMLQLYLGRSPSSASVRRQAQLLKLECLPEYDPKWKAEVKAEKLDYYTTYHATMAFHRLGGKDWELWNKALVKALRTAQEPSGCWPVDKWTKSGGRIYSTALATMALEVYYRYQ